MADTLLEPISGAGAILVGGRGEIPVGLHWRPGGQAARAQGRVMGACFGSSSVCTEQYSVWAHSRPQALRVSGTATLPGRLLVTTIEPTRQTPNSSVREGCIKQRVPKFGPEPNSPCMFWFKITCLVLEHNLGVFSHNNQYPFKCYWHRTCCEMSIIPTVVVKRVRLLDWQ